MAPSLTYSVADVLAVAKIHPFYSDEQYPPDNDTIQTAREQAAFAYKEGDLQAQPLLRKEDLLALKHSQNHPICTDAFSDTLQSKGLLGIPVLKTRIVTMFTPAPLAAEAVATPCSLLQTPWRIVVTEPNSVTSFEVLV